MRSSSKRSKSCIDPRHRQNNSFHRCDVLCCVVLCNRAHIQMWLSRCRGTAACEILCDLLSLLVGDPASKFQASHTRRVQFRSDLPAHLQLWHAGYVPVQPFSLSWQHREGGNILRDGFTSGQPLTFASPSHAHHHLSHPPRNSSLSLSTPPVSSLVSPYLSSIDRSCELHYLPTWKSAVRKG